MLTISHRGKLFQIPCEKNFTLILHHLSERIEVERFSLYYQDNSMYGFTIACQGDYRIYLRKLQNKEFKSHLQPILYVKEFMPNVVVMPRQESIEQMDQQSLILQRQYSEIMDQLEIDEIQKKEKQEQLFVEKMMKELNLNDNKDLILRIKNELENERYAEMQKLEEKWKNEYQRVCQLCHKQVQLPYSKCLQCFSFCVCNKCMPQMSHCDGHTLLIIQKPNVSWQEMSHVALNWIKFEQSRILPYRRSRKLHDNIVCDVCQKFIMEGVRIKCLQCPDYDQCKNCYFSKHHELHAMLFLEKPLNYI